MSRRAQNQRRESKDVVLYARVSTVEQAEKDLSLPAQLSSMKKYAEDKGYRVVEEFIEAGASGTDDNRPEFRRMLETVLAPSSEVCAVLVYQTSRFMRDSYKAKGAKNSLKKHGVNVIAVTQETSDDPMGQFMEGMFELVDEYESKVNGMRTLAALRENAKRGWFNGSRAPFGFRIERVEEKPGLTRGRIVPNQEEVPTHREVFSLYVSGTGSKSTARELNRRGLTYRGTPWSKAKVMKVVGEQAAIGTYFWGKKVSKTGEWRDKEDWIALKVDPILDPELFEMAQKVRASRDPDRNEGRTSSSPLLLAGLVKCGKCGASYQLESSGKLNAQGARPYRYYNCRTAARIGKEECSGSRIATATLEQEILEHLAKEVFTTARCQTLLEDLVEKSGLLREKTAVQRKDLRLELDEVERRIARWQEAFETGAMSQQDVEMDRYRELKARRLDLEDTLRKVVPLRPPPYLYTEANIQRFQQDLKRIFLSGKTSITKNYLKFLVEEILVTELRIDIKVKTRSALMLMSAEARNQESGTSEEAPEGVRTMVVPWLRQTGSNRRPSD